MAKFNYKFESIKKVKEALEKKVQKEINEIDLELDKLNSQLLELLNEKVRIQIKVGETGNIKASEIQYYLNFQDYLEAQGKKIKGEIVALEERKSQKILELQQKSKEVKIFETLKEKHFEDYTFEQNQFDQKENDEIATKKFTNGEK